MKWPSSASLTIRPPLLSDVYATITYILQHRAEVDEYMAGRRVEARRLRAEVERRFDTSDLRNRLLARRESAQPSWAT